MEEQQLLICVRCSDQTAASVRQQKKARCQDCRKPIWVTPRGLRTAANRDARVVCAQCSLQYTPLGVTDRPKKKE